MQLYSVQEASRILGITQMAVLKLVADKKLRPANTNENPQFTKETIENFGKIEIQEANEVPQEKGINYWMIPRSVRKLVSIQQMVKEDDKNGIIGGKWKGDRVNHKKRDRLSQESGLRGKSIDGFIDANPGGARTDVALLAALGLYYFDEDGNIQLTFQGEQMLTAKDPASILTDQLFQFRYPSPYSASIRMNPEIEIFPYRFLFQLMMREELVDTGSIVDNDGIIRITQKEIARFVIPGAKKDSDIDEIVAQIVQSRKNNETIDSDQLYGNIANTFINNIEITGFIERGKSSVWIKPDLKVFTDVSNRLAKKPREIKYAPGNEEIFQQRFGMDPTKSKYTGKISSNRNSAETAIHYLLEEEFKNNPLTKGMLSNELFEDVASSVGTNVATVKKIVDSMFKTDPKDIFAKQYLEYASGGRTYARDFEITTTKMLKSMLGEENARWAGKEGKSPDIVFNLLGLTGIVDCKAESNYNISNDHFNRMTVEDEGYIPAYKADFFVYIANGFGSTFIKNLRKVERKCGVSGSAITADDMLYLLDEHRKTPFTEKQLHALLTSSKIITKADINEIRRI